MPDWTMLKDREGNQYFIDRAGKIHITTPMKKGPVTVSAEGIDYYYHYGKELIIQHNIPAGLSVLKSILALPVRDSRVLKTQIAVSRYITMLQKREGDRFLRHNNTASLLLYRDKKSVFVVNDRMRYSFQLTFPVRVIRHRFRSRLEYHYEGVMIGGEDIPAAGRKNSANVFRYLVAVDSEKYSVPFRSVDDAAKSWGLKIERGIPAAQELRRSDTSLVYQIRGKGLPPIVGYEGIFINESYTTYIRIITSAARFTALREELKEIILRFKMVSP